MSEPIKIVYFGDGEWAHKSFDRILANTNFEILRVVLRHDTSDDVLRSKAEEADIEVLSPPNVNDPEFIRDMAKLEPDLGVSMSYNQIIKKNLMEVFPKSMINCHAGKLPLYRGRNVLNWALINGEKEIGVTCHYIDEGIDTGDIIVQKTFPVTLDDDYGTVLKKAFNRCSEVLLLAMQDIRNDQVDATPQPEAGSYFIERKNGDEFIDWNQTSLEVFNFVRAITAPGPYARSWIDVNGKYSLILIKEVKMIDDAITYNCIPGGVVGFSNDGTPLVKTNDTMVKITGYEIEDSDKSKLRIGDRLGINHNLDLLKKYKEKKL